MVKFVSRYSYVVAKYEKLNAERRVEGLIYRINSYNTIARVYNYGLLITIVYDIYYSSLVSKLIAGQGAAIGCQVEG